LATELGIMSLDVDRPWLISTSLDNVDTEPIVNSSLDNVDTEPTISASSSNNDTNNICRINLTPNNGLDSINEHRISIRNYSQASGLYKTLELMKERCIPNYGSGCHIHIDMTKTFNYLNSIDPDILTNSNKNQQILNYIEKYVTDGTLDRIFGEYTGKYNHQNVGIDNKRCKITIRPVYNTIEFRTAPMSFEYTTIIKWFIECNKICSDIDNYIRNNIKVNKSLRGDKKGSLHPPTDKDKIINNVKNVIIPYWHDTKYFTNFNDANWDKVSHEVSRLLIRMHNRTTTRVNTDMKLDHQKTLQEAN
jgi:hypothetical protein